MKIRIKNIKLPFINGIFKRRVSKHKPKHKIAELYFCNNKSNDVMNKIKEIMKLNKMKHIVLTCLY